MSLDNVSEFLYRTLFDRKGRVIERRPIAGNADAETALTQAQRDLRGNWQRYRAAFSGEPPSGSGFFDVDSVQAARITERIDQFFDFVRDVIDDPQILETIPDGSELAFRNAVGEDQLIRMTAYLPKHPGARWGARVTGVTPTTDAVASAPGKHQTLRDDVERLPTVAGCDTAEAALDALEAEISAAERSKPVTRRAVGA